MDAKERVILEANELNASIQRLVKFLTDNTQSELEKIVGGKTQVMLLRYQLDIMNIYAKILATRIGIWQD